MVYYKSMGKAVRGEPGAHDAFSNLRRALLETAAEIVAGGGPKNSIDQGYLDSASAAGISNVEIKAAAASKRPVLKGLEQYLSIDNF